MAFDNVSEEPLRESYIKGTNFAREMSKWNKPYVYQEYPRMLYKAYPYQGGRTEVTVSDPPRHLFPDDSAWARACDMVRQFNESCQKTVGDQAEFDRAYSDGWRKSHAEAMEYVEGLERAVSDAAAYRAMQDRKMSPAAQAEAEAADSETFEHLPVIPEKPRNRGGRPRKVVAEFIDK